MLLALPRPLLPAYEASPEERGGEARTVLPLFELQDTITLVWAYGALRAQSAATSLLPAAAVHIEARGWWLRLRPWDAASLVWAYARTGVSAAQHQPYCQ